MNLRELFVLAIGFFAGYGVSTVIFKVVFLPLVRDAMVNRMVDRVRQREREAHELGAQFREEKFEKFPGGAA